MGKGVFELNHDAEEGYQRQARKGRNDTEERKSRWGSTRMIQPQTAKCHVGSGVEPGTAT